MVRIIMHGCNGHMGQVISNIVEKDANAQIVAGIDIADQGKNSYPVLQLYRLLYIHSAVFARWKQMLLSIFPPRRLLIS